MDDCADRRNALPIGAGRWGTCLFSGEQNHEPHSTHYPTRIGGSYHTEDMEPREYSKIGGHPSNSKSPLPKSVSTVPKLGTSSSSNLKKDMQGAAKFCCCWAVKFNKKSRCWVG